MQELEARRLQVGEARIKAVEAERSRLIAEVRTAMANGLRQTAPSRSSLHSVGWDS